MKTNEPTVTIKERPRGWASNPARNLFDNLLPKMERLYSRWLDEGEYEDIKDYGEVIRPDVEKIGGVFKKMSKRPFGFTYTLDGAEYQVTINSRTYKYKRVK